MNLSPSRVASRWRTPNTDSLQIQVSERFGEVHFEIRLPKDGPRFAGDDPYITIKKSDGYWIIVYAEGSPDVPGLGLELYIAAISYASKHSQGLFSQDDLASGSALHVRPKLISRGVQIATGRVGWEGFEAGSTDPKAHAGVMMSGEVTPRFRVVNEP